ncbi:hypothetical protein [Porcipelethomonas sp.]|uniref:hypothetical protein n=1 Tax=Porcipelethomonas sp. TaxID=2981675 RepID=UPI003077D20E
MKILRIISTNLRNVLTSYGFYASVIITFVLCFSVELYYDTSAQESYSVVQVFMNFSHEKMLTNTDFCSYNVFTKGMEGWFPMFIPIVAAFPIIPLICDERNSKFRRITAFRTTKFSYNTGSYLAAMISGGLAVLAGFLLFAVIVFVIFPDINNFDISLRESFEWWIPENYPFFTKFGYPYLIGLKFLEIFLFGSFSAIPAFILTSVMKNKYLIICTPFFVKYMITQTYSKLYMSVYKDIENPNAKLASFLDITNLDAIKNIFSYGEDKWKNLLFYTVLLMSSYTIYYIIMNRRLDYGE